MKVVWRKGFGLVILFLLHSFFSNAQDEFDKYLSDRMNRDSIPGATLLIANGDKVLKEKGYGFANLEHKVPAKPETEYELASVSKPITATAIMLLVEEGKLSLDSSIHKWLDDVPAAFRAITLRQLMSHSSGLPMDHFNYSKLYGPSALRYTVKEQLADLFKMKLLFEPGTDYNYSNAGFFLQAAIIEKVTGGSYQDFIKARVFEKAGMKNSYFINGDSIIVNRSQGYTRRKGKWVRFSLENVIQAIDANGFGGVIATAEDEMKFCRALSSGKIVRKESFEKMITPTLLKNGSPVDPPGRSSIGLGWFTREYEGKRCLSHSGHTGTQVIYFPDQVFSVILFTNLTQGYTILGDRGFRVADAAFALADMAIAKWLK